jgi:uncharacterized membrane protein
MSHPQHSLLVRMFGARPRLMISALIGIAVTFAMPSDFRLTSRLLVGWDVGAILYLLFVFTMVRRAPVSEIKKRAALYDEGGITFLILALLAVSASFAAIFAELAHTKTMPEREAAAIALAAITVILSWSLTHVMFALHYAHLYYRGGHQADGGILMPERDEPDYSDFMYFSFVIGCASQTADISSTTRAMRKVMTIHGIISFFFNAAILALTINIAAGLV